MEKAKIGISVTLVGAFIYLVALFGGYTPLILVAGYILIAEESAQLKKAAVTGLAVLLAASCVNFLIGLLPDLMDIVYSLLRIFKVYIHVEFIDNIVNFLSNLVYLARSLALAGLAFLSVTNKPVKLPFIDKLFD